MIRDCRANNRQLGEMRDVLRHAMPNMRRCDIMCVAVPDVGTVQGREKAREQREKPQRVLYGKTKTATDNKRTLIYWEGTPRDPWHPRRARGPTPYSPPQMVTSASPIPKPPTKSPPKSTPSNVRGPPTPPIQSVHRYNIAAGTTRCR
jgi:hypothetical protein